MRRLLSSFLMAVALLLATVSLLAHVADRAALGASRPGEAVDAALADDDTRAALQEELTDRVVEQVPALSPAQADLVVARLLADPRLPAAADAIVGADRAERQRAVDAALTTLEERNPQLADRVRAELDDALPRLELPLVGQVEELGRRVDVVRTGAGLGAVVLAAVALLLGPRRDRLLRRVAVWAVVMAAVGVLLVWLGPQVLVLASGLPPLLAAASLEAAAPGLTLLFAVLAAAGIAGVVATRVLRGPRRA